MDWKSFTPAAALAILTGLTIVAYRHPKSFQRIGFALIGLLTIASLGVVTYALGTSAGFATVADYIADDKRAAADAAFLKAYKATGPYLFAGLGLTAYLSLLVFLPFMLRHDQRENAKGDKK